MPDLDLDDELARLRDGVRETLPVPDFDQVVGRHRQRVVRRRMQIGAVVSVLVVSLAVPLLREQMVPDPPPDAPSPPVAATLPRSPFISEVNFADAEHGYAIRVTCEGRPVTCSEVLLVTDGGDRWEKRPLPRPDAAPSWSRGVISLLGPDELTVDWSLSGQNARKHRVHSTAGGRTWQAVPVPSVAETFGKTEDLHSERKAG